MEAGLLLSHRLSSLQHARDRETDILLRVSRDPRIADRVFGAARVVDANSLGLVSGDRKALETVPLAGTAGNLAGLGDEESLFAIVPEVEVPEGVSGNFYGN